MDETGLFFRALPDLMALPKKVVVAREERNPIRGLQLLFFVSASGHKEKPVFIWKSENPRCLRGFDKSSFPVTYYTQIKAWMSGGILTDILTKLNRGLITSNRNFLLLMDNAGCHPQELVSKFSNIKIIFFPPNTTSCLQPLDLGIIQTFKAYYCKHFLTFVLSKIDSCHKSRSLIKQKLKSVCECVLVALRWVALAWQEVSPASVSKRLVFSTMSLIWSL